METKGTETSRKEDRDTLQRRRSKESKCEETVIFSNVQGAYEHRPTVRGKTDASR